MATFGRHGGLLEAVEACHNDWVPVPVDFRIATVEIVSFRSAAVAVDNAIEYQLSVQVSLVSLSSNAE